MRKPFLLLVLSLVSWLAATPTAQSAESVCFVQPVNAVPLPCLADTAGHQLIVIDPAGATSATSYYSSPSLESGKVVSTTNKVLIGLSVTTTTAAAWVMVFDAASIPGDGAVVPKACYATTAAGSSSYALNLPVTTGIVVVLSSTGCFTKTAVATAFFAIWFGG